MAHTQAHGREVGNREVRVVTRQPVCAGALCLEGGSEVVAEQAPHLLGSVFPRVKWGEGQGTVHRHPELRAALF